MEKVIELDAPLETLNRFEATGLRCKWNGDALEVTLDGDCKEDLLKFATALHACKRVTMRCTRIGGVNVKDIQKFCQEQGRAETPAE